MRASRERAAAACSETWTRRPRRTGWSTTAGTRIAHRRRRPSRWGWLRAPRATFPDWHWIMCARWRSLLPTAIFCARTRTRIRISYWGVRGAAAILGSLPHSSSPCTPCSDRSSAARCCSRSNQAKSVLSFYSDYEGTAADDVSLDAAFSHATPVRRPHQRQWCWSCATRVRPLELKTLRAIPQRRHPGSGQHRCAIDYVALQRSGDFDDRRAIGLYTKTGFVKKISPQSSSTP